METIKTVNHNGTTFKVMNGTFYDSKTPDKVIEVLEQAKEGRVRLRLDYGYTDLNKKSDDGHTNGQSWGEVNDITGYVGRSTGERKIALLVHNTRSMGGGAILTHCIVKITRSNDKNRVLYQHPTYKPFKEENDLDKEEDEDWNKLIRSGAIKKV